MRLTKYEQNQFFPLSFTEKCVISTSFSVTHTSIDHRIPSPSTEKYQLSQNTFSKYRKVPSYLSRSQKYLEKVHGVIQNIGGNNPAVSEGVESIYFLCPF
ncbi:hypothetical protein BVRB_3g052990 isoform A [Beta vulgaris subsp. vulgaris]|nr:hypothetical protein BVRB_3g052990 isoform A [Beta vulgaris subsp. vulgaris]